MKGPPTWKCPCGRALAVSRCEDSTGAKWLCADCVRAWWDGLYAKFAALLLILLLVGCTSTPKPLALVFSTQVIPHEAALTDAGWEVRHVRMPCNNDLRCWGNVPGLLPMFRAEVEASIKGRQNVLLVGVSRGGYLALSMADLPEVSRVAALAPMTEPNKPAVFSGPCAVGLDPTRIAGKPVFLQVGNTDDTIDTLATLRYAAAAMNPKLTVVVDVGEGHYLPDPQALLA